MSDALKPPRPTIDPDDRFVPLCELFERMDAEVIAQMLEAEGIATLGPGNLTAAGLGVGSALFSHVLQVPSKRLAEAKEVLTAFESGSFADDEGLREAEPSELSQIERPRKLGWTSLLWPLLMLFLAALALWGDCFR